MGVRKGINPTTAATNSDIDEHHNALKLTLTQNIHNLKRCQNIKFITNEWPEKWNHLKLGFSAFK